jgi:hypothetical protein
MHGWVVRRELFWILFVISEFYNIFLYGTMSSPKEEE